jgi:co-chaperonin GroES (HSP10)
MIKPVNGHILIEPVKHDTFIAYDRGTYEEIGIVIAVSDPAQEVKQGDKVFFDSWMAARYPKDDDSYYWLVKWSEIRAVEPHE